MSSQCLGGILAPDSERVDGAIERMPLYHVTRVEMTDVFVCDCPSAAVTPPNPPPPRIQTHTTPAIHFAQARTTLVVNRADEWKSTMTGDDIDSDELSKAIQNDLRTMHTEDCIHIR